MPQGMTTATYNRSMTEPRDARVAFLIAARATTTLITNEVITT
jgi:hypothetical protein